MLHAHPNNTKKIHNEEQDLLCAKVDGLEGSNVDAQRPQSVDDPVELRCDVPQVGRDSVSEWIFVNQGAKAGTHTAFKLGVYGVRG